MYARKSYDLAGFAVGCYDKYLHRALPCPDEVRPGDVIIGMSSSGLHSNGFSLARKVMNMYYGSDCINNEMGLFVFINNLNV